MVPVMGDGCSWLGQPWNPNMNLKADFQQGPHDQDNNGFMHINRGSLAKRYDGAGDGKLPLTFWDSERVNVVVATEMRRRRTREGLVSFAMFDECDVGWGK
ncbi:hypothetical protein Acr_24g0013310 [Actinidia rufa]|uniref:Uncharacterized protein n=1 Tax=Actinidia rufa TaxID=165716 RepID=A0A7J0GWN0_9ERIC|nr:hypothetical protein Acr_24g0013310 [Actinidia rufa]